MAIKIITDPGKFEGEPEYAPYVWDVVLNGWHDEVDDEIPIARVSVDSLPDDVPVPDGVVFFEAWESDNGFVFTDAFCEHSHPVAWSVTCATHPECSMQGPDTFPQD